MICWDISSDGRGVLVERRSDPGCFSSSRAWEGALQAPQKKKLQKRSGASFSAASTNPAGATMRCSLVSPASLVSPSSLVVAACFDQVIGSTTASNPSDNTSNRNWMIPPKRLFIDGLLYNATVPSPEKHIWYRLFPKCESVAISHFAVASEVGFSCRKVAARYIAIYRIRTVNCNRSADRLTWGVRKCPRGLPWCAFFLHRSGIVIWYLSFFFPSWRGEQPSEGREYR